MTVTKNSKKPQYKLLPVKLDNGTTVNIGRATAENTALLLTLQDKLLGQYVDSDGALGVLFNDAEFVSDLESACSLLPIVGKEEAFLNFEDISDNWEQLVVLFFNGQFNQETRTHVTIAQSEVSRLHFLPYGEMLTKHLAAKEAKDAEALQS
jgi:hypothetical protein